MDGYQVLIIEDDRDTAKFFSVVLGLIGYECEIVHSAREALVHLAASVPNMILLDMRLGLEVGGEEILYQLRSNPRFDETRVIVITAYPDMAEPISDLADLVLVKPVEVEQLRVLSQRLGTIEAKPKTPPFRDAISGLYNREFFVTRLELAFERAKRRTDFNYAILGFCLLPVELPEEQIEAGLMTSILQEAAKRLRRQLRLTDTIARLSGWKFVILVEELKKPEDTQVIIERLKENLSGSYLVGDISHTMGLTFGAAVLGQGYTKPEDLLLAAERSLEQELTTSA